MKFIMATTSDVTAGRMPRRARTVLNSLIQSKTVTPEGVSFLIAATDPFHDEPVEGLLGYPDMTACRSNVQVVTQTVAISSPFDDGITPWDLHVPFMPLTPCFTQRSYFPLENKMDGKEEEIALKIKGSSDNIIYKKVLIDGERGGKQRVVFTKTALMHVPDNGDDYFFRTDIPEFSYVPLLPKDSRITVEKPEVVKDKENQSTVGYKVRKFQKSNRPLAIQNSNYYRTTVSNSGDLNQLGDGLPVASGWNCFTTGVGQDWQTTFSGVSTTDVSINPEFTSGAWRLISSGCEVVNTTAELYKGGSCTVFRSPSIMPGAELSITGIETFTARHIGLLPPSTQSEAALYPDSKTWGAEDGSYQVVTLNQKDNEYYTPLPGYAGMVTPSSFTDLETGTGWVGYFPLFFGATDITRALTSSLADGLPFDCVGSVYSGLNPNTTMQVTTRYYFERHPTVADPDLLTLSKPSAPYDPVILELLARATRMLPVGVMVKENPMGEWFNDVLEFVGNWAPTIGTALGDVGVPMARLIGNGLGSLASSNLNKRQKTNNQTALVASSAAEKKVKPKARAQTLSAPMRKQVVRGDMLLARAEGMNKNQRRKLKRALKKNSG